ncbi:MAG: retropepsin-like domain-containing protein [Saprospiraceae bacterium]|nr:retropepsin-like domain-containing protein [Saprospiraceae bacterium]
MDKMLYFRCYHITTHYLASFRCLFYFISIFSFGGSSSLSAQQIQDFYEIKGQSKEIDINFEYINNLIIVNATFNGILPLRLVFDTGAEHSIIFDKIYTDAIGVDYDMRKVTIMGADFQSYIDAHIARNMTIDIGNIRAKYQNVLVTEQDYFQLSAYLGTTIHGILGADFIKNFVVKIDFRRNVISLSKENLNPTKLRKFTKLPCQFHNNRPYLLPKINTIKNNDAVTMKLLMDSGAALSLLLTTNTAIPPKVVKGHIGFGLGGMVEGYLGRVDKLILHDEIVLQQLLTNFQEENKLTPKRDSSKQGIIGNLVLDKFTIIIDYLNGNIYVKPNKGYNKVLKSDKSGLVIIASGKKLTDFIVYDIISSSPAEEAKIQKDDIIIKINSIPTTFYTLSEILGKFQGREGKKIKITYLRNGIKRSTRLRLRTYI